MAENDPTYRQFVDQQKEEKAQMLAESSSHPSFNTTHEEGPSQPPSAFAAFKTRLENESKESQITQTSQPSSSTVISHREQGAPPLSNEKILPERKGPQIINNVPDSIIAQTTTPASIEATVQPSIKPEQSPTHRTQPIEQNQENSQHKKDDSLSSPKTPLLPSNIRK